MLTSQSSNSSSMRSPLQTPTKKKSMRDLNTTTPLGGRPKAGGSVARVATVSLQPSPRSSPGRGLTLRIEDDMAEFSKTPQATQSAPVRPIRRLPALPLSPFSNLNIDEVPSTTPLTPVQNTGATPVRAKRALPCPPTPVIETSQIPTHVVVTPTPVERRRPLPIPIPPIQKVESLLHNNPSPVLGTSKSLPVSNTLLKPPAPKIPSPSLIATFPRPDKVTPKIRRHYHSHSASEKIPPGKKVATRVPRKLHTSRSSIDLTLDVVQLHRKFVVERSPICISLDYDTASEDEYAEEITSTAVFVRDAPAGQKEKSGSDVDEKELHADYSWLLANRILHPKSAEGRVTSKWMHEKKGKRYTEDDFDNILKALRNL